LFPEQNKSGQASVVLTPEAYAKYRLDVEAIEAEAMKKYMSKHGYTDTGGDVGTNLE
jgi:hypothetical protein